MRPFDTGDFFGFRAMRKDFARKTGAKTLQPVILAALDGFGNSWRRRATGTHFGPAHHGTRVTNAYALVKVPQLVDPAEFETVTFGSGDVGGFLAEGSQQFFFRPDSPTGA